MNDFLTGRNAHSTRSNPPSTEASAPILPFITSPNSTPSSKKPSHAHKPSSASTKETNAKGHSVELVQENGLIQEIIVTCSCGERITLKCTY